MGKIKTVMRVLLLTAIFAIPLAVFAIGQVTDPIIIKNALRGKEYQQTLIVVNSDKEEAEIGFSAQGDIAGWAKFYKPEDLKNAIETISMSAGARADIIARFKVPDSVPNGKYMGFVSAFKKAKSVENSNESSASVSQKIDREVTITISDKEIVKFDASIIPNKYDLAKGEPLIIRVRYDNQGNIDIAPQVQLKIKQDDKAVFSAIYLYPESEPATKPLEIREIPALEIPTNNFSDGSYLAEIAISESDRLTLDKKFNFSVGLIVGEPEPQAASGSNDAGNNGWKISWPVMGLAMLIILAVLAFSRFNKK